MKNVVTSLILAAGASALGVASCGDGNGVGAFSSGIDGSRTFASLNDQDRQQFCSSIATFNVQISAASRESSCRNGALSSSRNAADPVAACNTQYNACIMRTVDQTPADPSECTLNVVTVTCNLTVGEFESCINQALQTQNAAYLAVPTCDKAGISYQPPPIQGSEAPPCFADLLAKCPELFGNQGQSSSGSGGMDGMMLR